MVDVGEGDNTNDRIFVEVAVELDDNVVRSRVWSDELPDLDPGIIVLGVGADKLEVRAVISNSVDGLISIVVDGDTDQHQAVRA